MGTTNAIPVLLCSHLHLLHPFRSLSVPGQSLSEVTLTLLLTLVKEGVMLDKVASSIPSKGSQRPSSMTSVNMVMIL
jgi:hypothetical protein